ncbi:D-aminoacyl-tRNA deacylase [Companilactobacillus alimentarius]|uniref:D-aminoacyl-tRNA deacylase n=1 Tax=Companilactobacillus alimentarius DSM 20249 TaxID=1423720 RepID=A0A2K9HFE8_9LACO|nr:D-aminoacyl-tRNA deacylase [Companilactobacillus alimentarius]AUI71281.1 D-tyrosyl-tRNA(Tyr) deacylase [Companilactobacillus alimentarius DSM 20249]KRK75420.1 D-tyrosyl-tRNA(Tyr) deacylase [Companilactobacillus alimentarius DSM 20249]MDT6951440.1 D-aminoacyl-tRNA deacylase [Companilactobacillus alimentarius]GEO43796.1 D-aminoacyl-tRNA deacylase [Companilactobacillus alimentarius]
MKVVIQRVSEAKVTVDQKILGQIDQGFCLLVAFADEDNDETIKYMARKIANMRIFSDTDDKMNLSIKDVGGEILSISQFTLYAETKHGNRPSFIGAGNFETSSKKYEQFNNALRDYDINVETGEFGADMQVSLTNDGPVTILMER